MIAIHPGITYKPWHWVTALNYGCDVGEIDVYDSMSPALSTSLKQQIVAILFFYLRKKRNHREVSLTKGTCKIIQSNFFLCRYKHCQSQVGSSDCGLVSLAFVYVPAKGEDPSNYTFNQGKMRNHLFKCILHGRITDFPVTRIGYRKKK